MASTNEARRQQALLEIRQLRDQLSTWHTERTAQDTHANGSQRGQHQSQLNAIRDEVSAAAEIIDTHLQALPIDGTVGSVYERCATIERQVIWLWRVWDFFRQKFDQRNAGSYEKVLRAADEVVWSCFSPFFQHAATKPLIEPPPLPYIEADYSPSALRRDQRQALQRRDRDFALVQKAFETLPVSILKVPVTAINNPWSLGLIAHECGHIIQPLIGAPAQNFPELFQKRLAAAVEGKSGANAPADAEQWANWAPELFADWFSVILLGPWALWTMAQFELADAAAMTTRRTAYPAPVVRLALLAALADHYGVGGSRMLATLGVDPADVATDPACQRDISALKVIVPAIVNSVSPQVPSLDTLVEFSKDDFAEPDAQGMNTGIVGMWSDYLRKQRATVPLNNRRPSARMASAGCAMAWSMDVTSGKSDGAALRERAFDTIIDAAMPGVRSVPTPALTAAANRPEAGKKLVNLLERADEEWLADE